MGHSFFFHTLRKRRWNERLIVAFSPCLVGDYERLIKSSQIIWNEMHDAGEGIFFRALICVWPGQARQ